MESIQYSIVYQIPASLKGWSTTFQPVQRGARGDGDKGTRCWLWKHLLSDTPLVSAVQRQEQLSRRHCGAQLRRIW
jgi:hypothetical protein